VADLPTAIECARLYLAPLGQSFWRWSDDRTAVEWIDGGTIVLREEVAAFVQHRVDGGLGLPPFKAIVFLLGLLRERSRAQGLVPGIELPPTDALWRAVRGSPGARMALLDCALHPASTNRPEFAARVGSALACDLPPGLFEARDHPAVSLTKVAAWLQLGLRSLTAERLAMLAATGVMDPPEPAAFEPAGVASGEELLRELQQDGEFVGLAEVVRQILAAVRLPTMARQPEDQALGGAAGIGNHGAIDRLLPSELANEDDVLAVRIATNEALYVQREVPPRHPDQRQRILLDTGVRLWGTPRVLGLAVALAFQVRARSGLDVQTFVANGCVADRVDLTTRQGVARQLERLASELDARAAVPGFLQAGAAAATERLVDEPIVVASRDAVGDPTFRALFTPRGAQRLFVAELAEDGGLRLLAVGPHGWDVCASAVLDVRRLRRRSATELPAFYGEAAAPLRTLDKRADASREVVGIGRALDSFGLLLRGGRMRAFQLGARQGRMALTMAAVEDVVPFAPCPGSATPPLSRAELGAEWLVYYDPRGLLHFVPRDVAVGELSVQVLASGEVQGWCPVGGRLAGRELADRLRRIAAEAL
jgi:hypothetical protein